MMPPVVHSLLSLWLIHDQPMKFIKIILALVAALWALALVPRLLFFLSHQGDNDLAFSALMGSVFGILLATAISIALFRSASNS